MIFIGIVLILTGILGLIFGSIGYGDIGISFAYAASVALVCGIGFIVAGAKMKKLRK